MLNINNVVSSIKTDLSNLTWESDSGEGTTKFQGVYAFGYWENAIGTPFLCITLPNSSAIRGGNKSFDWQTVIELSVCCKWSEVEGQDDNSKIEEATVRMNEAIQAMREYLSKDATLTGWAGNVDGFVNEFELNEDNINPLQLLRKVFILKLNDSISSV
jgi:hypothetical protein